ncbi:MAG: transketolase, partial [Mailhella sp.]|nr:transketolase [Mailhella sp.]
MPTRAELANAIRALSMDAIDKAKSGHPGAPLGMADMAESLWRGFMKHNPADPSWANRDRFVLSNGHASMLMYSLLHLTGYDLSMDDIRDFRQFGAKTAGHPELGVAPGVEMTTGPLGQGISTAVGMALAERLLASEFNRDGFPVMDHFTYVFVGDGCLMEGVAQEACSLAGTWKLGRLIALYDANDISIDGNVKGWFSEDVPGRFEAMGWHVVRGIDGHDPEAIDMAIREAQAVTDKPSLIVCKTVIGKGAPTKAGSAGCHGAPLGAEETAAAKAAMGWTAEPFTVPADIKDAWDAREAGAAAQAAWEEMFAAYAAAYPELAAEFKRRMAGELPEGWADVAAKAIEKAAAEPKAVATRVSGKNVLNDIAPVLPELIGGSADLSGSVGTQHSAAKSLDVCNYTGNYIHYGVREFGMGTVMNGLQLHGGFIPYGGTFFVFSDYAKNVIRSAAIMERRVVWVLTHDSIGVGEDGPTHQPIEQICGLRTMPHNQVWRPCDSTEAAVAWVNAVEVKDGPVCLIMSRQNLAQQPRTA